MAITLLSLRFLPGAEVPGFAVDHLCLHRDFHRQEGFDIVVVQEQSHSDYIEC